MSRNFEFSIGEFYHLYNRGNDKREIFLNDIDKERFFKLLYLCNGKNEFHIQKIFDGSLFDFDRGETLVDVGAYCLMDNHYHLLIREKVENGISLFMHRLSTAYSMYFNKKYDKTGSLFAGRFKAKHLETDELLKYMFAYIHLNPIKMLDKNWKEEGIKDRKKAEEYLNYYKYSSYSDYLNKKRIESRILNCPAFLEYFEGARNFKDYIKDWLDFNEKETGRG